MLFDQAFVKKLGTKSLSKDPALTKERVNAAWKSASDEKRKEVLSLADVKYGIAHRVRSVGTITTKMTIAYSQVLDLDPFYLIGAVPDNKGYSYASAKKLLLEVCKIKKGIITEFEKAYVPPKSEQPPKTEEPTETAPEKKSGYSTASAAQKLNEDDLLGLFKALIIKATVGKPDAIEDMTKITEILMK